MFDFLVAFLGYFEYILILKKDSGSEGGPRGAQGPNGRHMTTYLGVILKLLESVFFVFDLTLRRLGRSTAGAHMQSVRAWAVETRFSVL